MSGIKAYSKLYTKDSDLNRVQEKVEQTLKPIIESPIINGLILEDITLTTGIDNFIEHKLDRELIGWIVIKNNTSSTIFDKQDTNVRENQFLILNTSANTTVSLWVF